MHAKNDKNNKNNNNHAYYDLLLYGFAWFWHACNMVLYGFSMGLAWIWHVFFV